ncbi:MAG: hypothetical protein WCA84_06545 [Ignavibacteriaceae bacterium]
MEPNIYDIEKQGFLRDFHNPLFMVLLNELDNVFKEKEISDEDVIDHFYIDQRENEDVTNSAILEQFRFKESIKSSEGLIQGIKKMPGMLYFLLGKKGIGKTTLLKYFLRKVKENKDYITNENDLIIYLDFKTKKSDDDFLRNLPHTIYNEIFNYINLNVQFYASIISDITKLREIVPLYKDIDNSKLAQRVLDKKEEVIQYLFTWIYKKNLNISIIIDNVDDFTALSVKKLIDKCIEFKDIYKANCILALRDYWSPKSLKITDSNICCYYLGKPNIYKILINRLNYVNTLDIKTQMKIVFQNKSFYLKASDFQNLFSDIAKELIQTDKNLHDMLFKLSNYNTREHLLNLYYFFHSPYLFSKPNFIKSFIKKINEIDENIETEAIRPAKFFDFLENFMTPHSLCFDLISSTIFNLFHHKWHNSDNFDYRNFFIFLRILQLSPDKNREIKLSDCISKISCTGYSEEATNDAISVLLSNGLLESADGISVNDIKEFSISAKGLLYRDTIIYEYSYLNFICDIIPMPSKYQVNLFEKYGNEKIPLDRGNLHVKHESVKRFIEYIKDLEKEEEDNCPKMYLSQLERIIDGKSLSSILSQRINSLMVKMIQGKKRHYKISEVVIQNSDG